jgi:hypothetical protein
MGWKYRQVTRHPESLGQEPSVTLQQTQGTTKVSPISAFAPSTTRVTQRHNSKRMYE